jgi:hypothetical protein
MAMFQKILEKKKLKSPYFYNRCSQNIIWFLKILLSYL